MPKGLRRFHHTGDWHFITCSCYCRQRFLDWARRRDLFLDILEQVRAKYDFVVAGYVVMPEHFHLLIGEPRVAKLSRAMQVLKAGGPAFLVYRLIGFSIPHDNEGAPSFAESAVLVFALGAKGGSSRMSTP